MKNIIIAIIIMSLLVGCQKRKVIYIKGIENSGKTEVTKDVEEKQKEIQIKLIEESDSEGY